MRRFSYIKHNTITERDGKNLISATILADSIFGKYRVTTFKLRYMRFIHAELMTHKLFSKNAASSRAIPVKSMIDNIRAAPAVPVYWGENKAGMQADKESSNKIIIDGAEMSSGDAWLAARDSAIKYAESFAAAGYHKQVVNRLIEPFKMMEVILTATEFDNFFNLRCHKDAQPEIKELADTMYAAYILSKPAELDVGQWHLPYVDDSVIADCEKFAAEHPDYDVERLLIMVSASCCAQVSYRKSDTSIAKAIKIYDQLVTSKPVHASPFEHQARPIVAADKNPAIFERYGDRWCANFRGWLQYRHEIDDNTCWNFRK